MRHCGIDSGRAVSRPRAACQRKQTHRLRKRTERQREPTACQPLANRVSARADSLNPRVLLAGNLANAILCEEVDPLIANS